MTRKVLYDGSHESLKERMASLDDTSAECQLCGLQFYNNSITTIEIHQLNHTFLMVVNLLQNLQKE